MSKKNVLVVDDDLAIQQTLKKFLEIKGFRVLTANNGSEALQTLQHSSAIDLVFLDLMMPVMDGFEFLEKRHSSNALSKIPVVVLTAGEDRPDPKMGVKVIQKPFRIAELLNELESLDKVGEE